MEDETFDVEEVPEKKPVVALKFPKFTSNAIQKCYNNYCNQVLQTATPKRYKQDDENDDDEYPENV